jgi:lysophospholipase L1-like esterase
MEPISAGQCPGVATNRVVLLGDSLTEGTRSHNYIDILNRKLPANQFHLINAGVNRELAYNVLQRLHTVRDLRPDFVTVLIGSNDANASLREENAVRMMRRMRLPQKPSPAWFEENLQTIVSRLQSETRARLALLSIPPIGERPTDHGVQRSREYSAIIRRIAAEAGVTYLPVNETMLAYLEQNPSSPRRSYDQWRILVYKAFFQHRLLKRSFDQISAANGFHLVVDFIHLNSRGAEIVATHIQEFLLAEPAELGG